MIIPATELRQSPTLTPLASRLRLSNFDDSVKVHVDLGDNLGRNRCSFESLASASA